LVADVLIIGPLGAESMAQWPVRSLAEKTVDRLSNGLSLRRLNDLGHGVKRIRSKLPRLGAVPEENADDNDQNDFHGVVFLSTWPI